MAPLTIDLDATNTQKGNDLGKNEKFGSAKPEAGHYQLINPLGRIMQSGNLSERKTELSLLGLQPGLYKLYIRSGTRTESQTIHIIQ